VFEDPIAVPFRMAHNSPLIADLPSFSECSSSLGLHLATASILDDMRFLFNTVLSLPADPTAQELLKVKSTSAWIYNRILNLDIASPHNGFPPGSNKEPGGSSENISRRSSKSSSVSDKRATPEQSNDAKSTDGKTPGKDTAANAAEKNERQDKLEGDGDKKSIEGPPKSDSSVKPSSQKVEPLRARPDFMYQVIRMAALIYARAIMNREPLSKACTSEEFLALWTTTWKVPLSTWKNSVGIFMWVMSSITPSCHGTPHGRFVKSMLMISVLTLGIENWHVSMDAARSGLKLQRWLRNEKGAKDGRPDGPNAGGRTVSEYGYHQPEW
jgi:hypothetical protein